ncbi:MAG: pseudouridine synthase [Rikenellaceae bacterium]|nr:pseudouridine synthase [Rikenellaceae bacterium]
MEKKSNTDKPNNYDDAVKGNEGASRFMKDRRPRIRRQFTENTKTSSDNQRKEYNRNDEGGQEKRRPYNRNFDNNERPNNNRYSDRGQDRKRSFNPNFDNNNRVKRRYSDGDDNGNKRRSFPSNKPYGNNNKFGDRRKNNWNSNSPYPSYDTGLIKEPVRLNKFISMSGVCSRREADELIQKGEITVNDIVVSELGTKVNPGDKVCHNGAELRGEKKVYIVMNKPKGFVTTVEDSHADKTVMDIIKGACKERVYPVGRLDKNSLGVLLITNDGELTKKLTHPKHEKKKIYQVSLDRGISKDELQKLCDGVELEDGTAYADEVNYVGDTKREIGIVIHTGRNRIVRRLFEALGYHVQKLDRVYFAGLTKKRLKRGAWRYLTPREVSMLKSGAYE